MFSIKESNKKKQNKKYKKKEINACNKPMRKNLCFHKKKQINEIKIQK